VPLQSGSDRVLSQMNRNYDMAQFEDRIEAARGAVRGLTVTTDVIAGFPGESEADFEQTREACERIGFSKIHVFRYSARRNTPAADSPDQVPPAVRRARARTLADAGRSLTIAYLESRKGASTEVLVEKRIGGTAIGTAPDHVSVSISSASSAQVGELLLVQITDVSAGGLIGEIV
jgi:threonylcarbamoyladenosine tRNA methylthiotransferase MtaB